MLGLFQTFGGRKVVSLVLHDKYLEDRTPGFVPYPPYNTYLARFKMRCLLKQLVVLHEDFSDIP